MYLRRIFKKLKIRFYEGLNTHTGIELRHAENRFKDRSYKNAEITRKFQSIEEERFKEMKEFLSNRGDVKKLIDDKTVRVYKLDLT